MKLTKKILLILLICLISTFSCVCFASDELVDTNNNDDVTTTSDDTDDVEASYSITVINTDLYMFDDEIVVEDAINGNVFAMGSTVTIKGEIAGDLFVLANTLVIEDTAIIYSNIFALANSIVINGVCGYDVYAAGNTFELSDSGYVYRDIKVATDTSVTISGIVRKDAYIYSNSILISEDAKDLIGGDLKYSSSQEIDIPEDSVMGDIIYNQPEETSYTTADIISSYITSFITTILYALVVILLATFFAPKFIEKANYTLMKRPFISAGIGILAIVLIPIIAILLIYVSSVFTYISIATIALYILILSITLPIFGMAVAKSIEKKFKTPNKGRFIGLSVLASIVLWLLQIIPVIGNYVMLFIFVVGLGIFLFSFFIRKDVSELGKSKSNKETI